MIERVMPGELGGIKTLTRNKAKLKRENSFNISLADELNIIGKKNLQQIQFRGNTFEKNEEDFLRTVEFNYFKLPKIKKSNGETFLAKPDSTQLESARQIYAGNNTITVAPTGTGKTAIANYAISKNLYDNKRTFYTTPLKALSNDKYREFGELYGQNNVGLMTGDIKINPKAPVVIMTTEIYRNMALGAYASGDNSQFDNVGTVVFDEAHYLGERERGKVWEESLMLTPKDVQILALSATIGNAENLTEWMNKIQTGKKAVLIESEAENRHVPLVYYNYTGKEGKEFQELVDGKVNFCLLEFLTEIDNAPEGQIRGVDEIFRTVWGKEEDYESTKKERLKTIRDLNFLAGNVAMPGKMYADKLQKQYRLKPDKAKELTQLFISPSTKFVRARGSSAGAENPIDYSALVEDLKEKEKLPAIIFDFSHDRCTSAAKLLSKQNLELTSESEKEEIEKIIQTYEEKGIYLGQDFNRKALLKGVAPHHAGMLPSYKKLVEELFKKKLLKVVIATSTLSAGINMPARTTVITSIKKPSNTEEIDENGNTISRKIPLSANEFHQMTGRAGRRGIDTIGNVILYNLNEDDTEEAQKLILQSSDPLISRFQPSYGFLSAYYQRFGDDKLLNYYQNNTFKVFQAKNPEKELNWLKERFKGYRNVLVKEGFLEENGGSFDVTPKGRFLNFARGVNELSFVNMIYDKKLENLTPEELAFFAGAATGSREEETEEKSAKNLGALKIACPEAENSAVDKILENMVKFDNDVLYDEAESGYYSRSATSDSFNGYLAYRFASLNCKTKGERTVENFKKLADKEAGFSSQLTGDLEDGLIYRTLTQSIDVLKQIIAIGEFALVDEDYSEDKEYYKNLIQSAKEAVELLSNKPIYDTMSI